MRYLLVPLAVMGMVFGVACDDDTEDEVQETVDDVQEDVEDVAGEASARAVAEALRGAIVADEGDDDLRSVAVIQENIDDLPGDPEVVGIADADGDGLDDDGLIEVRVGDQAACLELTRDDANVENGACA